MDSRTALERFRRRSSVAGLALLAVLCRAAIPAGFMPAALADGGPIVVCQSGLAGEFFRRLAEAGRAPAPDAGEAAQDRQADPAAEAAHAAHADHTGHAGPASPDVHGEQTAPVGQDADATLEAHSGHEGWEHCPFGAAFGVAALVSEWSPALLDLEHALEIVEPALPAAFRPGAPYRARAPPVSAIPA